MKLCCSIYFQGTYPVRLKVFRLVGLVYMKVMFAPLPGRDLEECRHNNPQLARTFGDTSRNPGYITFITVKRCHRCEIHSMVLYLTIDLILRQLFLHISLPIFLKPHRVYGKYALAEMIDIMHFYFISHVKFRLKEILL